MTSFIWDNVQNKMTSSDVPLTLLDGLYFLVSLSFLLDILGLFHMSVS